MCLKSFVLHFFRFVASCTVPMSVIHVCVYYPILHSFIHVLYAYSNLFHFRVCVCYVCDTPSMHVQRYPVCYLMILFTTLSKKKTHQTHLLHVGFRFILVPLCIYLCVWNRCSMNDRDSFFLLLL